VDDEELLLARTASPLDELALDEYLELDELLLVRTASARDELALDEYLELDELLAGDDDELNSE
jgi:hypothetical protein